MSRTAIPALLLSAGLAAALGGGVTAGGAATPHWQVFATRVPDLVAVDARSSSDVWAVGDGIVHWDGRTLTVMPTPWKGAVLTAVSVLSPVDVWAVGYLHRRTI